MCWVKTAAASLEKELQEQQKSQKKKNALMELIMKYFTNVFKKQILKVASLSYWNKNKLCCFMTLSWKFYKLL